MVEEVTGQYHRTRAQMAHDFRASKAWEDEVQKHLPGTAISRTDSTTELDYFVPGVYIEAKEKRQPLGKRWHLLDGVEEQDLFVLDELSLRKGLLLMPYCWFVFHDCPMDRLFVANVAEVAVADRVRRNRVGKGKLILSLRQFRRIAGLEDLLPVIEEDIRKMPWKQSGCLSLEVVPQI
jgi:hypothetical protein